jgi:phosphoribosylanthranilate isomerase
MSVSRTRIKVCGITRLEDALAAVASGVDALGFVFYSKSPRVVTVEQVHDIIYALPAFITTVGLFVDAPTGDVTKTLCRVPLNLLQFHGDEDAAYCEQFGVPYIKAIRVKQGDDINKKIANYASAAAILLDTYKEDVPGGTGESFDWALIPSKTIKPIILAGGLTPENVVQAITQTKPYAVDVSGGVEKQKGIKDLEKIKAFVRGVQSVAIS